MHAVIIVEGAGLVAIEAANADEAIATLEGRSDIRIVFTDIDMPGSMDGLKLAAAIRDRWPPVHIIITTGKSRPTEIPANAMFIPKPYLGRTVVSAMRTFDNMG
jgi:two-component system, response regulator PdtaR